MKTDRELLELAAKAAGIKVRIWEGHTGVMCAIDDDHHGSMWMPLTDDGDALRLAVKLGIGVQSYRYLKYSVAVAEGVMWSVRETVHHEECETAATRRAITRAAAAIGEGMK